MSPSKHSWCT